MSGIIDWKLCKECGRNYDFPECPFCREERIKLKEEKEYVKKRTNN